jgi:ribonuclease P/MRP protein subunit RPP40
MHLKSNRLLNINNSGFQENDSSVLRLLSLTDDIYQGLDKQDELLLVFMDISKAFDRVWHKGLIYKLKQSGIEGNLLKWFESYLLNRKQRVVVGGKSSDTKYIHGGVPQGSILGPLLFLLYVSDLSTNLENQSSLFADDTTIICPITNNPTANIITLNNDLIRLHNWADLWRITFNPDKTVYIRVSKKTNKPPLDPIYLNKTIIKEVEHHPNLGIIYNNKTDWKFHLANIAKKVALRMAYLKCLQLNLPRSALERIYTTMIRPIIEYGDIVYDNITITQSQQLEHLQRRAALICTGGYRHTEHRVLLNELGWDTLTSRRKKHRLTAYYKMIKNKGPEHILPHLPETVAAHHYNLRNRNKLIPRFTRLTCSLKSFFPKTTRDWNELPLATQTSESIGIFKKRISSAIPYNSYTKYHIGRGGVWLTRIRMGLSALNNHRFTYNMIPSPTCTLCNTSKENTLHFFWDCPCHAVNRNVMVDRVGTELGIQLDRANVISICVNGDVDKNSQQNLFNIISEFLKNTSRFQ